MKLCLVGQEEKLNKTYKTPVFNGANEKEVIKELKEAGLPATGKMELWDGRTGEKLKLLLFMVVLIFLSYLIYS